MTEETVFVEILTDEELAVLSRPGNIAVSPYLDDLPAEHHELAKRTAYRSLLARGIVDPPTPEAVTGALQAGDGSVDLMVRQDVRTLVTLRQAARAVVAVARTTSLTQDFWYAHLTEDVVLVEEVGSDGLHRFALANEDQLAGLVVAAAVHPEAGDSAGDPIPLPGDREDPVPPDRIVRELGRALLRCDLVIRYVGDHQPPLLGTFTGPGGSWLVAAEPGRPPVAEPLRGDELRSRIHDAVDQARAEVAVLVGS